MSYESDQLHDWYVLFHYGTPGEILEGSAFSVEDLPAGCLEFPVATVDFFEAEDTAVARALDIGCAVGRSSFELSRFADEVIGIDYSFRFIEAADAIKSGEPYPFAIYSEGHLGEKTTTHIPDGAIADRVSFEQGDAMNLREDLGQFDLVHAANLLCRLPEPKKFLERLTDLVKPGGQLVMATPATWSTEYTPAENIPTGETLEYLKENLGSHFDLVEVKETPFFIREHKRKFQLSSSQTSRWVRKAAL